MADDETVARHIEGYGLLLAQQVEKAGGWPKKFRFPEPATDAEREALRLFMQEVEATTGVAIKIAHFHTGLQVANSWPSCSRTRAKGG